MDDLFVNKIVKVDNIQMPDDLVQWVGFIKDRFYTEHPYIPESDELNVVMEKLDPSTKTAVGYIKLVIYDKPYYVPVIINAGRLYPMDVIIDATGKATAFIKEFYQSINYEPPVFGDAVKRDTGTDFGKMVTETGGNQVTKLSSLQKKDDGFLYCIIKRAGFNEYEVSGVYKDGLSEPVKGDYKLVKDFKAEDLMKKAGIGDEAVLLPQSGKSVEILNKKPDETLISYDTPGAYTTFTQSGDRISGTLIPAPLNPSGRFVFLAKEGYTFTENIYGLKLSDQILIDPVFFTDNDKLDEIVDVEPLSTDSKGQYAGYIYGSTRSYNILIIKSIVSALHQNDGRSYYIARTPAGTKIGLITDPNIATNVLKDISADSEAKGDYMSKLNPDKVYLTGVAYIVIPANKLNLRYDIVKTANYKGADKGTLSIKRGQYIYNYKGKRYVGDETLIKKAMAETMRITEWDFKDIIGHAMAEDNKPVTFVRREYDQ